jgi:lipopolysaccharide biosynthesis glycosyltransferase
LIISLGCIGLLPPLPLEVIPHLPLSALHPVAIPGEATFQCPARVRAAAHALKEMEPVVIALASNERYFPGLYCAVASALRYLDRTREVDLKVLDGGISQTSRDTFSKLIDRVRGVVRLEFVTVNPSVFGKATLGPGESHMTYCRILLPHLLDVSRLIYLDCDVLVFRDLSPLFDLELSPGKVLAAVPDSETLSLAEDCPTIADAMGLPAEGAYFNCGVMLMNLDALRKQDFFERAVEFLNRKSTYRFWDQSAINFLLYGQIDELPEYWNRASWRFDAQQNNDLDCVLHYTTSAPWLGGTWGPAQMLFERFAVDAALPVNLRSSHFKRSARRHFWRNALAPLRALAFSIASLWYQLIGKKDKSAAYEKVARYWIDYIRNAPRRRVLHRQRSQEINRMKFNLHASPLVS